MVAFVHKMVKCLGAALETAGGSRSHAGAIKIVGVMFYSRPKLPQLGIDLVEFEEDGPRMSTFWGRDVLGRPISKKGSISGIARAMSALPRKQIARR